MNKSINDDYIEYKVFCNISAFDQSINKNLVELFITVNDYQIYFPKFICFYTNTVYIDLGEIDDIVNGVLY